jgi:hypothetical protein
MLIQRQKVQDQFVGRFYEAQKMDVGELVAVMMSILV